jgi:hypothetical protein
MLAANFRRYPTMPVTTNGELKGPAIMETWQHNLAMVEWIKRCRPAGTLGVSWRRLASQAARHRARTTGCSLVPKRQALHSHLACILAPAT